MKDKIRTNYIRQNLDEEASVDFCPQIWFRPKYSKGLNKCGICIWEVCFLCFCLPLCYPCYFSRHWRKRKKNRIKAQHISPKVTYCTPKCKHFCEKEENEIAVTILHSKSSIILLSNLNTKLLAEEAKDAECKISQKSENHVLAAGTSHLVTDCCAKHKERKTFKNITNQIFSLNFLAKLPNKNERKDRELRAGASPKLERFYSAQSRVCSTEIIISDGIFSDEEELVSDSTSSNCGIFNEERELKDLDVSLWVERSAPYAESCLEMQGIIKDEQDNYEILNDLHSELNCDKIFKHTESVIKPKNAKQKQTDPHSSACCQEKVVTVDSSSYRLLISEEGPLDGLDPDDPCLLTTVSLPKIVFLVFADTEELTNILNKTTGIIGYIGKYWRGFFPLLLIQTCPNPETDCPSVPERESDLIEYKFSSCHRLVVPNMEDDTFLLASVVRYHLHLTHCRRRGGDSAASSLVTTGWKCSQCGLTACSEGKTGMENKKKLNFFHAVRKNIEISKFKK